MSNKFKNVDVLIGKEQIDQRICELGREISQYYDGDEVVVVSVLNGAFMFTTDLIRHFDFPMDLKFVRASSYGSAQVSSGEVSLNLGSVDESIRNKRVLILEDIVDTGHTFHKVVGAIKELSPKEVKFASLLFKPSRLEREVNIDYLAFEIEDKFVIGYGLDLDGFYRELPFIGVYSGGA